MSIFDRIISEVDRGRKGLNQGVSMRLPKLESMMDGITPGTYTLIMSNSGAGKSSFALYAYCYRALMEKSDDPDFRILYVTLEMSAISMFIKLMSIYIYEHFGKVLSYREILSRKREYVLDDESYGLILRCRPWIEKIEGRIEFYDNNVTATGLGNVLKDRLGRMGTFSETATRRFFSPKAPGKLFLVIIDHIGLLSVPPGSTLKQEIDAASKMLVGYRELCGISAVVLQQANREHASGARIQAGRTSFSMSDSKDSGNTVQDCQLMLAIYDPAKDSQRTYRGYDVEAMNGAFRSIQILKSRYGECDVEVPMTFFGSVNWFSELPRPEQINSYSAYNNPYALIHEHGYVHNGDKG